MLKRTRHNIIVLLVIAVALSVFWMSSADKSFQEDSENLAISPIFAERKGISFDDKGYGLGALRSLAEPHEYVNSIMDRDFNEGYKYFVYTSQFGLQGHLYRVIARYLPSMLHAKIIIFAMKAGCCFLLAIVVLAIIYELFFKYGRLFALTFGAVTILSPWVINYSINLYWVAFTWYIPMLLGLLCINYENKRYLFYPMFFAAIFIKSLCGYEYLSTIMMAEIQFLLVEWVCNEQNRKKLTRVVFIIGVLSMAGFSLAYLIHAYYYGSGNIMNGIRMIAQDIAGKRCFGNASDYDLVYSESLNASVVDVLVKYFCTAGRPLDGIEMMMLGIATTIALIYKRIVMKKDARFEISLYVISLLTTISWLVLAKGHSYIHTHMNFVLFYFGWVQCCVYIILKTLTEKTGYRITLVKDCK